MSLGGAFWYDNMFWTYCKLEKTEELKEIRRQDDLGSSWLQWIWRYLCGSCQGHSNLVEEHQNCIPSSCRVEGTWFRAVCMLYCTCVCTGYCPWHPRLLMSKGNRACHGWNTEMHSSQSSSVSVWSPSGSHLIYDAVLFKVSTMSYTSSPSRPLGLWREYSVLVGKC